MPDTMEERDALAEALEEEGWEVIDTFGGLRESPSLVVEVEGLEIDGETFDPAELTVTVSKNDVRADRVEISDDVVDLTDDQREFLDSVSDETLSGPEITLWEYEPGTSDDDVDDYVEDIRGVYEEL